MSRFEYSGWSKSRIFWHELSGCLLVGWLLLSLVALLLNFWLGISMVLVGFVWIHSTPTPKGTLYDDAGNVICRLE